MDLDAYTNNLERLEKMVRAQNTHASNLYLVPAARDLVHTVLKRYWKYVRIFERMNENIRFVPDDDLIPRLLALTQEFYFAIPGCARALKWMDEGATMVEPVPTLHAVMIGAFTPHPTLRIPVLQP